MRSARFAAETGLSKLVTILIGLSIAGTGLGAGLGAGGAVDLISDGSVEVGATPVGFHDCPNGATVGQFHRGDRVLVTGRSDDGEWLETRAPHDLGGRVWVPTRYVVAHGSVDHVPVAACDQAVVTVNGEPAPTTTTTAVVTTTTRPRRGAATTTTRASSGGGGTPTSVTSTTQASGGGGSPTTTTTQGSGGGGSPTTTTSPPSDTTGPSIGSFSPSPTSIQEYVYEFCPSGNTSTVSVSVSDPSGVQSVSISWSIQGDGSGSKTMSHSGGSTYQATIGPFPDSTLEGSDPDPATVTLTISATDASADHNSSTSPSNTQLKLHRCT